ncbi:MAG: UDP-N-acetylmuramate dehydrogenase [Opitutales bacterium]
MPEAAQSVFIAGITGMGNAPLALYLAQAGWQVSGWDDRPSPRVAALLKFHGIDVRQPRLPERLDLFAYSSAVREGHPLRREARQRGVPSLRRGELLARLSQDHRLLAVVGSHGKTTTAALLIHFLEAAGMDFSYVLGGLFQSSARSPARHSPTAQWLVAEVDESDGTIDAFAPEVTLVVNLDWDHPDQYPSYEALEQAFAALFQRTRRAVLYPAEQPSLERLVAGMDVEAHSFGPGGDYALLPKANDSESAELNGHFPSGSIQLPRHDPVFIQNATAALAATQLVANDVRAEALLRFDGVHRRQEVLHRSSNVNVLTDYAHHPAELEAVLAYARQSYRGPLLAVFQPHRFSRTQQYAGEFAQVLCAGADQAFLLPVYAAGETPLRLGTRQAIVDAWPASHRAQLSLPLQANELASQLRHALVDTAGGTVLFVGAGDIDEMARGFAREWGEDVSLSHQARARPYRFSERVLEAGLPPDCLRVDEPLAPKTTWRVGGPAAFYAEPTNADAASLLLQTAAESALPVFILGRGSNVLVPDRGFPGLVLRLAGTPWARCHLREDGRLEAGGGLRLKQLCAEALRLGLDGFGFLEGIPGTVGGALQMNAGAMGGWVFDRVASVRLLTARGDIEERPASAFTPGYRQCPQLEGCVVLSAVFEPGPEADAENLRRQMDTYAQKRRQSQPRESSAGSTFRNPPGDYAGRLIEQAGLKGATIGGAQVSELHANFIVNTGEATAAEIVALMRFIRHRVLAETGIVLEPEVVLAGRSWEEVLA